MTELITPGAAVSVSNGTAALGAVHPGTVRAELPGGLRVVTETVPGFRSVSLGIWSLATFFSGFVRTYVHLFLLRMIVGVG